ncbi:MAG: cytochrome C [Gammaproteobacteria bacterium]|nr:cytochrome C [Gammaproteobacteria bacterium]MDP6695990.1 cytochrome C [Gammaproteobacteria bacterium]
MLKKIIITLLAVVVLGAAWFVINFTVLLPRDIPVPEITLPTAPEEIERGRYLATHVAVCMDCHSRRNWDYFAGPIIPGTLGKGGEVFDRSTGLPGVLTSKNITPYNLGDWSDGELFRAITGGLQKDGDALFPLMPYDAYRTMDERDVLAIMAYLRTIAPIENDVGDHELDFPLSLIVNSIPLEAELSAVNRDDPLEYGEYLSTLSGCTWCHTPINATQQLIPEQSLAGGHDFFMGGFVVRSANISPDPETGIGNWSEEQFIARFREYQGQAGRSIPLGEEGYNSLMPWTMYADMTDADLGAIYTFLMQSEPRSNKVTIYE